MNLSFTESFQRDLDALSREDLEKVRGAILAVPRAFREAGRHTGLGLRKIHASGIWEVRIGLDLRIVFALEKDRASFRHVMDHNGVRRYLKSL